MSSVFTGKLGLRHQYDDLTAAELVAANSAANAVLLLTLKNATKMMFVDNTLDKDVALLLVHPDADSTVVTNRLFWLELPSNRVINYDLSHNLEFDPGTQIMVYALAAPATGKLRIAAWG